MIANKSGVLNRVKTVAGRGRHLLFAGAALLLTSLFTGVASTKADAQSVHFRYVGGRWSHSYHDGWHRYWGGPSIGFYFAPAPVYVVPGYAAPTYYTGPDFWYSNPSFGLSLNFGGGGYYGGRDYHRDYDHRYYGGDHDRRYYSGDHRDNRGGDRGDHRGGRDHR